MQVNKSGCPVRMQGAPNAVDLDVKLEGGTGSMLFCSLVKTRTPTYIQMFHVWNISQLPTHYRIVTNSSQDPNLSPIKKGHNWVGIPTVGNDNPLLNQMRDPLHLYLYMIIYI